MDALSKNVTPVSYADVVCDLRHAAGVGGGVTRRQSVLCNNFKSKNEISSTKNNLSNNPKKFAVRQLYHTSHLPGPVFVV